MTKLNEMSYEELIDHVDEAIRALRIKVYGEGYKQGRVDERMDAAFGISGKEGQELRDEIIERSKRDVQRLIDSLREGRYTVYGNMLSNVDFIINKKKRTIVALIRTQRNGLVIERGKAKCLPNDCFNVHIGKAIALRRALSLLIPDEYLNAPQPTEVRVGDIIQYAPAFSYRVDGVCGNIFDLVCIENGESYGGWVSSPNEYKIIDDSRGGVTE